MPNPNTCIILAALSALCLGLSVGLFIAEIIDRNKGVHTAAKSLKRNYSKHERKP